MSVWKRFISGFTGKAKSRVPSQMELLGAPQQLVEEIRGLSEEDQERAFMSFIEGKHGCMLDWKAKREDIFEELAPVLTAEEKQQLSKLGQCPDDATATIRDIRHALSVCQRAIVHTESLGDFSFLILVPKEIEPRFLEVVGPWVINDGAE